MATVATIAELRTRLDAARADGATVGFVPTLGSLHAGHASHLDAARSSADVVVASIFVNPLQFAPTEDLAAYPRDLEGDIALCAAAGVDLLFVPSVEEMYPDGPPLSTTVSVAGVSAGYEGASRPGHFDGVATVVAKLLAVVGPCRAHFGEKDWQQLAVVRRMVADLSLRVEVVGGTTVREPDGLALSSRNVYLDVAHRAAAPALHRALQAGAAAVAAGERDPAAVRAAMHALLVAEPLAEVDYLDVVDAATVAPVDPLAGELRLLGACRFGPARLLDNVGVVIE
ncbi:MAG: pantoate--beta-alanine ligase [Acidimicrobiia bacterium]|jgi:pantoate--beta-alanine ligase|nr:pantoate--beta-alanine ligase [Acidimicrobiia bacterium]